MDKEIESFCAENEKAGGIRFEKEETCVSYEFMHNFSNLYIKEHELDE